MYCDSIHTARFLRATKVGHDTVSVKASYPVNGGHSCAAFFRCPFIPAPFSLLCPQHLDRAIEHLRKTEQTMSVDLSRFPKPPLGSYNGLIIQDQDWQLPSKDYVRQLELLQELADTTRSKQLLLIDSEFCILPRKSPSIFQVAMKTYSDPEAIINANVHTTLASQKQPCHSSRT